MAPYKNPFDNKLLSGANHSQLVSSGEQLQDSRETYLTGKNNKKSELQRKQVLNGSAWKSGGHLYHRVNPKAITQKHKSGLFTVYVDPPVAKKVVTKAAPPTEEVKKESAPEVETTAVEVEPEAKSKRSIKVNRSVKL